jgi:type II secretory pathway pseudopilin PulG
MTLVEIMIVVGISSVVMAGLFYLIKLSTQIIWTSGAKLELQQNAQDAIYWIKEDFRSAKLSSIGNAGYNPGFESPQNITAPPDAWQDPFPAGISKIGVGSPDLKSGFYAIKANSAGGAVNYESAVSSFPYTGNYIFSGWIKSGGATEIRLLRGTGADFSPAVVIGSAAATGYWQHYFVLTSRTAGEVFKIRLANLTPGTESFFDDISVAPQEVIFSSATTVNYLNYDKFIALRSDQYRLYYDSATLTLYRQIWGDGHWSNISPDPLGKYMKKITIRNADQKNFSVTLEAAKRSRVDKEEEYQLNTSITPMVE